MSSMISGNYNYTGAYQAGSYTAASPISGTQNTKGVVNPDESTKVSPGRKSSPSECQTCANRKYQDGSDEMVSFKAAAHISPEASASRVRAHEQEHVNNAYSEAARKGGKVLSANVTLKTAICPECGRSYVAGGVTATKIKYPNESDPYMQNRKSADVDSTLGKNVDVAV